MFSLTMVKLHLSAGTPYGLSICAQLLRSSQRYFSAGKPNASVTALRWFVSDTAHIVFIHITSVWKSVYIVMARKRVSESCSMAEVYFHGFVHFDCVPI